MLSLGKSLRSKFPILKRKIRGKRLVYLDSAATTQKPIEVIREIENYYMNTNANVHRGLYKLAEEATSQYESSRKRIAEWFGSESENLIFTRGTTESINLIAKSWGNKYVSAGDRVLAPLSEHHSNYVPWQMLCEQKGAEFVSLPLLENLGIDKCILEKNLAMGAKILAFSAQSNVLGNKENVKEICELAKKYGVTTIVDGAQIAGHSRFSIKDSGCDFFAFSGHKMFGPMGIGGFVASDEVLKSMPPWQGGGEMISDVKRDSWTAAQSPYKFEAGTPNVVGAIALSKAVDILDEVFKSGLEDHVLNLSNYAYEKLKVFENVKFLAKEKPCGAISFWVESMHPHDLATILDQDGIAIRAGHHCAKPLHQYLNVQASVRLSLHAYNDIDDIDDFIESLKGAFSFLL